ncbi:MAG TPA: apolipoprotein N-acyltransferase, partial [Hellea balneolensis]|nr:apolipoprotein N-acyltransferase [Hellea balneolensis]
MSDPSLEQAQKRAVFARGFWFGLGYFLFGLYWIGAAFLARGGAFVWIMPVAVFVMCAGLAIFWGGAALLFVKLRGAKVIRQILVFTLVFTGGEVLRGHVFGGFPWNLPGYIFEGGKPVSQSAHFIGIYGLTALVFLFAGALGALAVSKKFAPVIVTALVFLSLYGYGYNRLKNAEIKYLPNVTLRLVHA